MKLSQNGSIDRLKLVLLGIAIIALGGVYIGWKIGRINSNKPVPNVSNVSSNIPTNSQVTPSTSKDVRSLVSYTLPDGWKVGDCPNTSDRVFIIPAGASLNCNSNPSAPIKISIDPGDTKDCQQLANVQNVKKHICSSLFINDRKSLKSLTEYLKSASYSSDTTISEYYIDTGKGVIKVEYQYTSSNEYQIGFDQLVNSIKVKS